MDRSKWEYKKLTDVCSILYGYPFDSKCFNETNQGRPLIRIRDVVRGYTETYTTEDCPDDYIINEGDYLVGMDGEFNISSWKSAPALLNQRVCKISADGANLIDGFMFYLMKTKLKEIEGETAFVTVKHLSAKVLNKVKVQLPSILDQQRIVAELDCLNEMIAVKQEQLKEFDKLAQSIFYDMFGDPVTNEKGWKKCTLSSIAHKITDGVHKKPNYTEYGMPFVSVVNINKGVLNFEDCKYVSYSDGESFNKRCKPEKDDILYTKVGATYGIPALVNRDDTFCLYVSVCLIKPIHEIVNSVFLLRILGLPYIKEQADKRIKGIGVPDLHLNQISNFDVILPPLSLQQQFAEKISAIEAQKEQVKQSIAETQALLAYTMDKYFG